MVVPTIIVIINMRMNRWTHGVKILGLKEGVSCLLIVFSNTILFLGISELSSVYIF